MFGAFFGGTIRGAHHGFDFCVVSPMTPPNFGAGAGNCFPSIVVVALGAPGVPVVSIAVSPRPAAEKPPMAAKQAGVSYEELIQQIVEQAISLNEQARSRKVKP